MKKALMIILILSVCFNPVWAQEEESFKFFDIMFGVFPNPDGEINTYAFLKINYTPLVSSSAELYDKKYARVKTDYNSDGDEIEEIDSIERRDINVTLAEFYFDLIERSEALGVTLSPGIQLNYFEENVIDEYNVSWMGTDDRREIYLEKFRSRSWSYMPIVKADLIFTLTKHVECTVGAGYLFRSFDKNKFKEFSTTTEEDLAAQIEAYWESDLDVDFESTGYTIRTSVAIREVIFGSIQLSLSYMYKKGTSKNEDRWWDPVEEENVFEEYDADEERTMLRFDAFYYLDFLKLGELMPALKFGWAKQLVEVDGEENDYLSYQKYDFGIALKF